MAISDDVTMVRTPRKPLYEHAALLSSRFVKQKSWGFQRGKGYIFFMNWALWPPSWWTIILEFPAVLTWAAKKSAILFRSVLIKLSVSYLAGELSCPSPIKFSSLIVQMFIISFGIVYRSYLMWEKAKFFVYYKTKFLKK